MHRKIDSSIIIRIGVIQHTLYIHNIACNTVIITMSFIFVYLLSLSLLGSVDEFLLSTKEEIKNRCVVTMLSIIFENEVMMMLLMLLMMTPS